jgi:PAS domain S-box-containing protein
MCARREINVNSLLEAAQIAVQDADRIADMSALAVAYPEAESVLQELASVFFESTASYAYETNDSAAKARQLTETPIPNLEAKYRALVEQIPAVVFMAYLDERIGETYVSPQIEALLGFTQEEWLQDPVRWYQQVHPDDKQRWSLEAAQLFLSGEPLRSAYRVLARDGRVIWFHCEAKMIRREDGRPWFIHGVGFDITDLKKTEEALQEERNVVTAILDTVGALVVVLDPAGRIIRFNRACERTTGYAFEEVRYKYVWELFTVADEAERFRTIFEQMRAGQARKEHESHWVTRDGSRRLISWSGTALPGGRGTPGYIIATGVDITERKRLEQAILEISVREQRRIGQDLHDGLGQHLTGIAFMSKVQERKLAEKGLPGAEDAAKIVRLVNEAIEKTRELSRGLLPVLSESRGLMSGLQQFAREVEHLFGISCTFLCVEPVLIHDDAVATHLYHITQEAVNNAIKHGKARNIVISLGEGSGRGALTISDNGSGIQRVSAADKGMGLDIMNYRAKMIGGMLDIAPGKPQGTVVTCRFPVGEDYRRI